MAISLAFRVDKYVNVWKANKVAPQAGCRYLLDSPRRRFEGAAIRERCMDHDDFYPFSVAVKLLQRGNVASRCYSKTRLPCAGATT